jgi:hypothetical protein
MVEIIKRGEIPGERVRECTCNRCQTIFSFKEFEAQYSSDQRDGDALKIACPVCNQPCWVTGRR